MHRADAPVETIAETSHLQLVSRGGWSYVRRRVASGVVTVVALTDDDKVLLVEQYRVPLAAPVIEFPAGLAGDVSGSEDESLLSAARRELLEETGFEARSWKLLFTGPSSAGLTDEVITFFLATGLFRSGPGGGDESESIVLHEVPRTTLVGWLGDRLRDGCQIDSRLFSGLFFLDNAALADELQRGSRR